MRYLITGGLGYVGSWVTHHLAQQGHDIFVLSRGTYKPDLGVPYSLVSADITETSADALANILPSHIDGCIHAASYNESFHAGYAKQALLINSYGTRILLDALVRRAQLDAETSHQPPVLPLVIYCSTVHVFGAVSGAINDFTLPAPRNDYALTHLFAEEYCRFMERTQHLPAIVIRLTNSYGVPRTSPFSKWYLLLNDLCKMAFTHKKLELRSNPAIERDFIWLGDVARAMECLLQRPDLAGQSYILGSGTPVSITTVAHLVAKTASEYFGQEIPCSFLQTPEPQPALTLDTSRLQQTLGISWHNKMREESINIFKFIASNQSDSDTTTH